MDTKLKPEGYDERHDDYDDDEKRSEFFGSQYPYEPHESHEEKEPFEIPVLPKREGFIRRRKKSVNRLLGLILLSAALGLLVMGLLCQVSVSNAQNSSHTIYGSYGTSLTFYPYYYGTSAINTLALQMEKLSLYVSLTKSAGQPDPLNQHVESDMESLNRLLEIYGTSDYFEVPAEQLEAYSESQYDVLREQIERYNTALSGMYFESAEANYNNSLVSDSTSIIIDEGSSSVSAPSMPTTPLEQTPPLSSNDVISNDAAFTESQQMGITMSADSSLGYEAYSRSQTERLYNDLMLERDILFYATLPDGATLTNITAEDNFSRIRETSWLAFSLFNPPDELRWYAHNVNIDVIQERFRSMDVNGEIFIPSDVMNRANWSNDYHYSLSDDLTATWRYGRQLDGHRSCIPFFFILFIIVKALGVTVFRKSFLWSLGFVFGWYRKQPLLLKISLTFLFTLLAVDQLQSMGLYHLPLRDLDLSTFLYVCVCSAILLYFICSVFFLGMLLTGGKRVIKNELEIRSLNTLFTNWRYVLKSRQKLVIVNTVIGFLMLLLIGIVAIGVVVELSYDPEAMLLVLLLCGAGFFGVLSFLSLLFSYAKTTAYTADIARGVFHEYPGTDTRGRVKGWFNQPLLNLNHINDGMRKAVDNAVRSERLKTELITNVSHDLKTPLTSIINYVALLKETSFGQSETAAEYVDVIDKKTQRLQVLIDDLFEVAKLNSGSSELKTEDVNIVDLLKQALGELSEKIDASGIQFICQYEAERMVLRLDGKKMWRVFENIIGNILKYAPIGSRAYVSVAQEDGNVWLIFKNVSNYALDFEPEELFERFKRGDKSRSTEGSGLGLSIARSIVERSGGWMRITTDGDLFKVMIGFPAIQA